VDECCPVKYVVLQAEASDAFLPVHLQPVPTPLQLDDVIPEKNVLFGAADSVPDVLPEQR
jgi:hypothetical protein